MASSTRAPLRLLAQDAADLEINSAAVQDAVVKVGDVSFEPASQRLTIALNRFRWEAGGGARVRSGFQLGSVLAVQTRNIRRDAKDAVMALLAIEFEEADAPGGLVTLSFAGGGDIRVTVECIEAVLADVSPSWPTPRTPAHEG
jgi:hypothetical protein